MYRLKYYYKNGTPQLSENSYNDIVKYDGEIRQLTKNDEFKPTENDRKDFIKYLKLALQRYNLANKNQKLTRKSLYNLLISNL